MAGASQQVTRKKEREREREATGMNFQLPLARDSCRLQRLIFNCLATSNDDAPTTYTTLKLALLILQNVPLHCMELLLGVIV